MYFVSNLIRADIVKPAGHVVRPLFLDFSRLESTVSPLSFQDIHV